MLTLLAESKTMSANQNEVSEEYYNSNKPILEDIADALMLKMSEMQPSEIAASLAISGQLAVKARNLAYDFPYKQTGYPALEGFTGEAFRSLDISTLSPQALQRAERDLKFISSVYGILDSSSVIKPYRNEFNKALRKDEKSPIQLFKPKVTVELAKYIKENKVQDIINLLPADADKCIDWKILRAFTKVHKVVFQIMQPDGTLKTPIAKRLKELRGLMARDILMNGISTFSELINFESDHFVFSPEHSKPLLPVFLAD
ncbi:MAG: YaaA family protein [Muribaculaceae bacterium]|nr:YaaA family protein [Muribaculaceae bacterium]